MSVLSKMSRKISFDAIGAGIHPPLFDADLLTKNTSCLD